MTNKDNKKNKREIKIPFVAIQLTSSCNLSCSFCFRRLKLLEASLPQMKQVVKKLSEYKVETLVLSGGEPLLVKNIKEILKFSHQLGIKNVLQTNSILLKKKFSSLAPYINWISTSLDGYNEETNALMRSREQFNAVLEMLPVIKKHKIKIKLGTVVSRKNYKNIKNIGKLIKNYVTVWKLYQFYPRVGTYASENEDQFIISEEVFLKTSREIKKFFPDMCISLHLIKEFNKSPCLLIDPNGDVFITKDNKDQLKINKNFNKTYKG